MRQMLGMKGAALETNIWKIRVQLTKPVTWIPLIWGECGFVSRPLECHVMKVQLFSGYVVLRMYLQF